MRVLQIIPGVDRDEGGRQVGIMAVAALAKLKVGRERPSKVGTGDSGDSGH